MHNLRRPETAHTRVARRLTFVGHWHGHSGASQGSQGSAQTTLMLLPALGTAGEGEAAHSTWAGMPVPKGRTRRVPVQGSCGSRRGGAEGWQRGVRFWEARRRRQGREGTASGCGKPAVPS